MLQILNKRKISKITEKKIRTDVNFDFTDDLIYYIKDNNSQRSSESSRLVISSNCEREIFAMTHDDCSHLEHHRAYLKLIDSMYISRLSRKLRQYIQHCSSCQLNQTKRHASYKELMSISTLSKSFQTIVMNFVLTLSEEFDILLTITCKIFKRLTLISDLNI